jgi:hypothetical protein
MKATITQLDAEVWGFEDDIDGEASSGDWVCFCAYDSVVLEGAIKGSALYGRFLHMAHRKHGRYY